MKKVNALLIPIFVVLLLPLLGLPANSAWAATYYFDATNGNDATGVPNDIKHPYKTFQMIVYYLPIRPGDSILLKRGGVWRQNFDLSVSGSPGLPITISAYGTGNKPIIHGGTLVTGWSGPDGNGVYHYAVSGIYGLLEDDLILKRASNAACADGNWYCDNTNNITYYRPTSGVPGNHTVDQLSRSDSIGFNPPNTSYITIDNIKFVGIGIYGSSGAILTNITIQNCDFTDALLGVYLQAPNGHNNGPITIQDNTFTRCGVNVYLVSQGGTSTATIQRNLITYSNLTTGGGTWAYAWNDRGGLSLQNLVNSTVQHNDISGLCDSDGGIVHWISNGVAATGNVFMYNYIHDIVGTGISHGSEDTGTANCLIAYNIIKNFGTGGLGPYGGIRLNRVQIPSSPSGVYNNVILNGDISIYLNAITANYIIENNISFNPINYHVRTNVTLENDILDHNAYYPDTGTKFKWSSGNDYDFADWQKLSGRDVNSLNQAPLFVNSDSNYRLEITSPCIGRGKYVNLTRDIAGVPVPSSCVNIGAYQKPVTYLPCLSLLLDH